ncbi:MAG: DNA methyltransferase [Candidatus Thermoplasmatota archaeon]
MEKFDEFAIWWRIAHSTRIAPQAPDQPAWLERWMLEAERQGTRALEDLRKGVEQAIEILGAGFLKHPRNKALHQKLESKELAAQDYYHQVLRLVYRLIFLFVTEDRGLLLDPKASADAKKLFADNYGTQRLRKLAHEVRGSQHHDQFEGFKVVMDGLKDPKGCPPIGIVGLNGSLWSKEFMPDLDGAHIRNLHFLRAVRRLTRIQRERGAMQTVDYQRLASEELGSIYESLLELEAEVQPQDRSFKLAYAKGNERRTTGSHYTPTDLIDLVLDHALNPLLDEAQKKPDPERALLELTVCDPTCGSGHFLIAAAHRIAHRLAQARTGEFEPGLTEKRRALRDVVGRCIYGVDINPLSVELAKVGLWLEAMEPGKPLTFLDHHIKCGNALIGAFPEYLEKGIPAEAYTVRDGIDKKEACRELVALNKQLPMDQARLTSFRADAKRVQVVLAESLARIDAMPDQTVAQILDKESEYERGYKNTEEYVRFKNALDAWCAAFTYAKIALGSEANLTNGQLIDFLHPDGAHAIEVLNLISAETRRHGNQFFHWSLEFPKVFAAGGFTAIVGNPPYMGGSKVSGTLGAHYNSYLAAVEAHYSTTGDLASAFVLKATSIVAPIGSVGMITTNSIGKGTTRENGLAQVLAKGWRMSAAFANIPWQGAANVVVALLVLRRDTDVAVLNGQPVDRISSRLDSLPEDECQVLSTRKNQAFKGDQPGSKGFLISPNLAQEFVRKDGKYADVLHPFLNASDLLQEPGQTPSRWAICFRDWPLSKATNYPLAMEVVESHVRPEREKVVEDWWLFERYRKALRVATTKLDHVIVRPETSDTVLFIRQPTSTMFSHAMVVIARDGWEDIGVLNSAIHEAWFRRRGTAMKMDLRYTTGPCYEEFPEAHPSPNVAKLGQMFHAAVIEGASSRRVALTAFWNLVNDPACHDAGIEEVRRLRREMTAAVAAAFGFEGIDFRFGFYEDHAGRSRYTVHPAAADQIYLALVKLNGAQAAAAVKAVGRPANELAPGQQSLIGQKQARL